MGVKKGEAEIPGLTDNTIPRRLGPKRASKIRKLFNLTKEDDVCQYVIKRPLPLKDGKKQKFSSQGTETGDSSDAAEEETQTGSEEEERREEQTGCCRVCQDTRAQTEGGEGGKGTQEEEVRFSPWVQEVCVQSVISPWRPSR